MAIHKDGMNSGELLRSTLVFADFNMTRECGAPATLPSFLPR